MSTRGAMLLALSPALLVATPGYAHAVKIELHVEGQAPPVSVSLGGDGGRSFAPIPGGYGLSVTFSDVWSEHSIRFRFSPANSPVLLPVLTIRTWLHRNARPLNITYLEPLCDQAQIAEMRNINLEIDPDILGAILSAQIMLAMPSARCASQVKPELARLYFKWSCELARRTDFFVLPSNLFSLLRQYQPANADRDVGICERNMRNRIAYELTQALASAPQGKDGATLRQAFQDRINTLRGNNAWLPSFARLDAKATPKK